MLKLKKPDKDHRGEWDFVLDNDGLVIASVKMTPDVLNMHLGYWEARIMMPLPSNDRFGWAAWTTWRVKPSYAVRYFYQLGVDTAPLEKLIAEKEAAQ
jgi:hypothetical protein